MTGILTSDLESGDGPHRAVASLWAAGRICTTCWDEPAVDDDLGAACIRRLAAYADHPSGRTPHNTA